MRFDKNSRQFGYTMTELILSQMILEYRMVLSLLSVPLLTNHICIRLNLADDEKSIGYFSDLDKGDNFSRTRVGVR